jgi:sec-independent protein translocase protein TatA
MRYLSNPADAHLIRTFAKDPRQNPTTEYPIAQLGPIQPGSDPVTMGSMLGNIGPLEIIVVLIIALIVFGPKRLPELGSSLGRGIREFRSTVTGDKSDDDDEFKAIGDSKPAAPAEQPVEPEVVHDKRS